MANSSLRNNLGHGLLACLLLFPAWINAQVAISRAVLSEGGGAASAGIYTVSESLGESPVGLATSANYAVSEGFWGTFGSAPVPDFLSVTTGSGSPTVISSARLIAGSDADGDGISLTGIDSGSAHGGKIVLAAGVITYTPPNGYVGLDSFHYSITDQSGDSAVGVVSITVTTTAISGPTIISENVVGNGGFHLHFLGPAGTVYTVQASTNLVNWIAIGVATETTPGIFDFTDINARAFPHRFYRLEGASLMPPPLPPTIMSENVDGNGGFHLHFLGTAGTAYTVQATTNLVNWIAIGVATETAPGIFDFTDTNARAFPHRFYRLQSGSVTLPIATAPNIVGEFAQSNGFHIHFQGATNTTYGIQATTNLASWLFIGLATQTAPGVYDFIDTNSFAFKYRLYRIEQIVQAPATILSETLGNGAFTLTISGAGNSYSVLSSTNLVAWNFLGPAIHTASNSWQFIDTSRRKACFYRVSSP